MRLLLVFFAVLVLCAGCGQRMSKKAYEKRVANIGKQTDSALVSLFEIDKPPSADQLFAAADELEEATNKLDDLSPPKTVDRAHKHFVKAMGDLETWVRHVADQMALAKTTEAKEQVMAGAAGSSEGAKVQESFQSSIDEYSAAGVKIFNPSA